LKNAADNNSQETNTARTTARLKIAEVQISLSCCYTNKFAHVFVLCLCNVTPDVSLTATKIQLHAFSNKTS